MYGTRLIGAPPSVFRPSSAIVPTHSLALLVLVLVLGKAFGQSGFCTSNFDVFSLTLKRKEKQSAYLLGCTDGLRDTEASVGQDIRLITSLYS